MYSSSLPILCIFSKPTMPDCCGCGDNFDLCLNGYRSIGRYPSNKDHNMIIRQIAFDGLCDSAMARMDIESKRKGEVVACGICRTSVSPRGKFYSKFPPCCKHEKLDADKASSVRGIYRLDRHKVYLCVNCYYVGERFNALSDHRLSAFWQDDFPNKATYPRTRLWMGMRQHCAMSVG